MQGHMCRLWLVNGSKGVRLPKINKKTTNKIQLQKPYIYLLYFLFCIYLIFFDYARVCAYFAFNGFTFMLFTFVFPIIVTPPIKCPLSFAAMPYPTNNSCASHAYFKKQFHLTASAYLHTDSGVYAPMHMQTLYMSNLNCCLTTCLPRQRVT